LQSVYRSPILRGMPDPGQGGGGAATALSDEVASKLLDTIISNGLEAGHPLPSERELGEQYGVSRTVVREAVRGLAAKGVIEVRMGRGPQVAAVGPSAATEALGLFLHGRRLDYDNVHEVRVLLEAHVAALAASRATPVDVEQIRAAHERMKSEIDDVEAATRDDLEFHRAIVRAAHNDIYLVLLDSIGGHLLAVRRENLESGYGERALAQHEEILTCIERRDAEAARAAMAVHLEAVARNLHERQLEKASKLATESGATTSALLRSTAEAGKGEQ
jgi:GntR family transcriptional regulator, transcriptional repressor for pyruvate dehydrogenase complex